MSAQSGAEAGKDEVTLKRYRITAATKEDAPVEAKKDGAPLEPYAFTISGRRYELTPEDLQKAVPDVSQPIYDSYVEIEDVSGSIRQVPTKDLIRRAIIRKYRDVNPQAELQPGTGFQSQRAEQIARRLGLRPGAKAAPPANLAPRVGEGLVAHGASTHRTLTAWVGLCLPEKTGANRGKLKPPRRVKTVRTTAT